MADNAETWRKCAEHWKRVADQEATKSALEHQAEITRLRQRVKMLERLLQNYGVAA